jgi:hypothetical protein
VKNTVTLDMASRSQLKVKRRFGETYLLQFKGQRIRQAINQCERKIQIRALIFTLVACYAYSYTLNIEATCSSKTNCVALDSKKLCSLQFPPCNLVEQRTSNQKGMYSYSLARPPLWSSVQSSWLQIHRSGFDSRRYQIF